MNEIGGGAYAGLWAAKGNYSSFNDAFQLVGENIFAQVPTNSAGLQARSGTEQCCVRALGIGMGVVALRTSRGSHCSLIDAPKCKVIRQAASLGGLLCLRGTLHPVLWVAVWAALSIHSGEPPRDRFP